MRTRLPSRSILEAPRITALAIALAALSACNKLKETKGTEGPAAGGADQKACDDGDLRRCDSLGVALDEKGKSAEARAVLDKACKAGAGMACHHLGILFHSGRGGGVDEARAVDAYRAGCDKEVLPACSNLGIALWRGRAGKPDFETAAIAFQRACPIEHPALTHDGAGCAARGQFEAERKPPDFAAARASFNLACERDHDLSTCADLAIMNANGQGAPADPAKAFSLAEKACDGKLAHGCVVLGELYSKGLGTPKDLAKAKASYDFACKHGDKFGCDELKKM